MVDELLEGLPESVVRTEALVVRCGYHLVASEYEQAAVRAREALPRIEGLDRPDLRARAFDVLGASRVGIDDGGLDDQRRSIEIAREGRAMWELHHAINNRGSSLIELGLLREFEQNLGDWRGVFAEMGGSADNRAWFLAAQAEGEFFSGRWDAALEAIDSFLAEFGEGRTHYLESDVRPIR